MSADRRTSNRRIIVGVLIAAMLAGMIGTLVWILRGETPAPDSQSSTAAVSASAAPPAPVATARTSPAIYTADFSASRPAEFSAGTIRTAKTTKQKYLGPFTAAGVNVTLNELPVHQAVRITFDLALFNSWNGTSPYWGPDIWSCSVAGGPSLVHSTFCNTGWFSNNNEQSYPDEFPLPVNESPHPAWSGGSEHGTLGDMHTWAGSGTWDTSAIYHMDWTIPHSDPKIVLNLTSKPKKRDKTFGLLSFRVEALPTLSQMTDDQLLEAWKAVNQGYTAPNPVITGLLSLMGNSTTRPAPTVDPSNGAVWSLIATGDQAVSFIAKQLGTASAPPQGYSLSRIRHVLEVIHTPAAAQLLLSLPTVETATP